MSGPSQPKVEGEQWSDERVKSFLELQPQDGNDPDYHVLKEAYQHMTLPFFERFLAFFVEAGKDINAKSLEGESIFQRVSQHKRSAEYVELLKQHGAS